MRLIHSSYQRYVPYKYVPLQCANTRLLQIFIWATLTNMKNVFLKPVLIESVFKKNKSVFCAFWLIWYSTKRAYVIMIRPSCIVVVQHRWHLCTAFLATGFRIETSYLV